MIKNKKRTSWILALGVGILVVGAAQFSAIQSFAGVAVRHVLMTVADVTHNGQYRMVNGEIAYDPSQKKMAVQMGTERKHFPMAQPRFDEPALSAATVMINRTNSSTPSQEMMVLKAGSYFRFSDRSVTRLASDLSFDAGTVHASTAFALGWNYLYWVVDGANSSMVALATYGHPSLPSGVKSAYVASVYVDEIPSGNPHLVPATRVGTRTVVYVPITLTATGQTSGSYNQYTFLAPLTAAMVSIGSSGAASTPCVWNLADGPVNCASTTGWESIPRAASGNFEVWASSSGTTGIRIYAYTETLDSLR